MDSIPASYVEGLCDFYIPVGRGRVRRDVLSMRKMLNTGHPGKAVDPSDFASSLPKMNKTSLLDRIVRKYKIDEFTA